ncbi:MAG: hypothetical protein RLZZ546_1658 [Bacteroidota bacterium]|jgi:hypothetical protein
MGEGEKIEGRKIFFWLPLGQGQKQKNILTNMFRKKTSNYSIAFDCPKPKGSLNQSNNF